MQSLSSRVPTQHFYHPVEVASIESYHRSRSPERVVAIE